MTAHRLIGAALAAALVLTLGACGRGDAATAAAEERVIMPLDDSPVPSTLHGLDVEEEDIAETLEGAKRPYLEAATLYSLREGTTLQATLQVGQFTSDRRYQTRTFRQTLANRVADGVAADLRMGDDTVWMTSGDRQSIAIWFKDEYIFILSAREEYDSQRALLREALEITP